MLKYYNLRRQAFKSDKKTYVTLLEYERSPKFNDAPLSDYCFCCKILFDVKFVIYRLDITLVAYSKNKTRENFYELFDFSLNLV